jgi:hypothetical protein
MNLTWKAELKEEGNSPQMRGPAWPRGETVSQEHGVTRVLKWKAQHSQFVLFRERRGWGLGKLLHGGGERKNS